MSHNLWPVDRLMTHQAASLVPGSLAQIFYGYLCMVRDTFVLFSMKIFVIDQIRSHDLLNVPSNFQSYVTNVSNVTLRRDLLVVQRANVR